MILSINQPAFLPWIGYFKRISKSDIHLILDNVQIELRTKNSFTNRNKIKSNNGSLYLTVPLKTKNNKFPIINEVEIDNNQNWMRKHLETIKQCYSKSPYFDNYFYLFEEVYSPKKEWLKLIDLIYHFNDFFIDYFNLNSIKIIKSSELKNQLLKNELLINYCKYFQVKTYLSGPLGKNYIDEELFAKNEIKVIYDIFKYKEYPQINGKFIENLSIIDLLFNLGDEAKDFFRLL